MAQVVGWLVFLLCLAISIGVHELGHMLPAKRFGVRVPRYMVGFGPTVWSTTRGETEYGVKAIPLGGFTKLTGMLPPAEAVGAKPRSGAIAQLVQEARDASADEIPPGEDHRAFYRLSVPKKVAVMAGGILANLVLAVVALTVVIATTGLNLGETSTTVAEVGACVYPADAPADFECSAGDPVGPAAAAGVEQGDVLVSFDGRPIHTWVDFTTAVRESSGVGIPLVVERDGRQVTLTVDPVETERPVFDDDGAVRLDADGRPLTAMTRFVGVSPGYVIYDSVASVAPATWRIVVNTADIVIHLPQRLADVGRAVTGQSARSADGVVGLVGMGQVSSAIAAGNGLTGAEQISAWLVMLGSLNVALFVFNLIPLVPLDGGHVAGALWEGAKRQYARLRGLPRPAPADMARMMPLAYGVFLLFGAMTIFLAIADLIRPVTG